MNDEVGNTLKHIILENGVVICNNNIKLKSLLFDLIGDNKKEIYILITALQHNIVNDILSSSNDEIDDFSYFRMVNRICEDASTLKLPTAWAVKAWIEALGKVLSFESGVSKLKIKNSNKVILDGNFKPELLKRNKIETYDEYAGRIQILGYLSLGKVVLRDEENFEIQWNSWVKDLKLVERNKDFNLNINSQIVKTICGKHKEFNIKGRLKLRDGQLTFKEISLGISGDKEDLDLELDLSRYLEKGVEAQLFNWLE